MNENGTDDLMKQYEKNIDVSITLRRAEVQITIPIGNICPSCNKPVKACKRNHRLRIFMPARKQT